MSAPQYLYLTVTQLLISIYLILIKKEDLIKLNFIDISYIIFLFFSLVSFFKSVNINESIVEFTQFLTLFITYYNLKILFKDLPKKQQIFLTFYTVLVTIESLVILSIFIENYSFEFGIGRIRILEGLSSNINISSFSLLIKVPFLIYIFSKVSTLYYKFAVTLILSIVIFCIVILASRGALIGLLIILIGLLIFEIYQKNRKEFKFKLSSIFLSILSFVFVLQYSLYTKNTALISLNRISNLIDTSSSDRIDYYKTAIELFSENPILGVGIGNWKIVSIKNLGSKIYNYTIPYHVHNDILQIFSETGLIGGISFFMILMLPIIFLIKYCWDKRSLNEIAPFLLLAFVIHLLDSNLNFPRIRPFNQMNFIFLLSFFTSQIDLKNLNKPIKIRKVSFIFIFLLFPLNILHTKFLLSYQEIYNLHIDFNTNSNKLQAPIEVIEKYQETYPNITNTTLPLKVVKANYFFQWWECYT
jgi:O-antigen ligase